MPWLERTIDEARIEAGNCYGYHSELKVGGDGGSGSKGGLEWSVSEGMIK